MRFCLSRNMACALLMLVVKLRDKGEVMGVNQSSENDHTETPSNGGKKHTVYDMDAAGNIIVAVGNSHEDAWQKLEAKRRFHDLAVKR